MRGAMPSGGAQNFWGGHVRPLSVGVGRGRKAVLGVATGCLGLLLIPVILISGLLAAASGSLVVGSAIVAFVVVFVVLVIFVGWFALRAGRYAAHLEGTELVVREALSTKRCDLASARDLALSKTGWAAYGNQQMARLTADNDTYGGSVSLQLRGMRGMNLTFLPPAELLALADAIDARTRPQPYDQQARQVSAALRHLAHSPIQHIL